MTSKCSLRLPRFRQYSWSLLFWEMFIRTIAWTCSNLCFESDTAGNEYYFFQLNGAKQHTITTVQVWPTASSTKSLLTRKRHFFIRTQLMPLLCMRIPQDNCVQDNWWVENKIERYCKNLNLAKIFYKLQ